MFSTILPSGRAAQWAKPNTDQLIAALDSSAGNLGKGKLLLMSCLRRITRGPLPGHDGADAEEKVQALCDEANKGAGGGWVDVTEKDLVTLGGERSFDKLFGEQFIDVATLGALIIVHATGGAGQAANPPRVAVVVGPKR